MNSLFKQLLAGCLVTALATSQEPPIRQARFASLRILDHGHTEVLSIDANETAEACVLEWTIIGPTKVMTASLPFIRVGDLTQLGGGRYLISGKAASGAGVLVSARLERGEEPAIVIEASASFPGIDLYSAAWSDGRVVALDFAARKLFGATWDGASTSLAGVSLTEIADETTVRSLAHPAALTLKPGPQCVYLLYGNRRGFRIAHDDAWRFSTDDLYGQRARPRAYEIQAPMIARSMGPIMVSGEAGAFTIVDEASGSTVGGGTISDVDTPVSWSPSSELVPGNSHRIEGVGGAASRSFAPLVRYGQPSVASTIHARRGLLDPAKAIVGSTDFVLVTNPGGIDPVPVCDEVLPAALWIHLRTVDGIDPIVLLGEQALLDSPPIALGFTVPAQTGRRSTAVSYPLPIPADPSLAGAVMLFQFGFERMGSIVVTDVFGTTLRDAGEMARGAGTPTRIGAVGWDSRLPSERSAIHSAATRWVRSLESTSPAEAGRLYRELRSR